MTPPASNPSASSSVFGSKYSDKSTKNTNHSARETLKPLKKDLVWQRYKEKNAEAARQKELLMKQQSKSVTSANWKSNVISQ